MIADSAAYGLRLRGLGPTPWLAVEDAAGWPEVAVVRVADPPDGVPVLDLERGTVAVAADAPLDVVVHPLLAHAGLALARSGGHDAIHAGALLGGEGAWLVVGGKEVGKSTLMAAAAAAGIPVLTDDVAVLRAGTVLAGPRCVDLRRPPAAVRADPPSAAASGAATPTPATVVRRDGRWRVSLPPVTAQAALRGLVFPVWGARLEAVRLGSAEILRRVLALQADDRWPQDPRTPLDLAALPAFELRRPVDLAAVGASVDLLAERVGA